MLSKKIFALSAGALLFATSAVAQVAPTSALFQTVAPEETGVSSEALIGVGFALATFAVLLAFSGDSGSEDDEAPVSP